MTDYSDLIARLEKAEGPSREIDALIDAQLRLGPPKEPRPRWIWDNFPHWRPSKDAGRCEVVHDDGTSGVSWTSPSITASLDAVIALTEKMLPGWRMALVQDGPRIVEAIVSPDSMDSEIGKAKTLSIALLIATLKSLQSLEQKDAA